MYKLQTEEYSQESKQKPKVLVSTYFCNPSCDSVSFNKVIYTVNNLFLY